jgi:hypothetical protein
MATATAHAHRSLTKREQAAARTQRARAVAARLDSLRAEFPEFARHIDSTVKAVKLEAKRTPARDLVAVLRALRQGCATLEEIADEARLPRSDAQRILSEQEQLRIVERRLPGAGRHTGRGGTRHLFFLRGTPAGTDCVTQAQGVSSFVGFSAAVKEMWEE